MVTALRNNGLLDSTLIIISAKHGNSPIDPATLVRVDPAVISAMVNTVAPGLALLSADTGPLIWLKDQSTTSQVVAVLDTPANRALAHIDQILWGSKLPETFADPLTDSRAPDIALVATPGTVYTTSATKIADHGSFSDEDAHVALLVSAPSVEMRIIGDPVETRQIACTILKSLGMECDGLMSEQIEPSKFLPHSDHKNQ
jgi:arylsulfatase A-like enzyme